MSVSRLSQAQKGELMAIVYEFPPQTQQAAPARTTWTKNRRPGACSPASPASSSPPSPAPVTWTRAWTLPELESFAASMGLPENWAQVVSDPGPDTRWLLALDREKTAEGLPSAS